MKIKVSDTLTQNILDIESIGETSNLVKTILLLAHPVGSYYWSSEATEPSILFGGTWTQIKDKFIIAVGDEHTVGTSYGSNIKNLSHTHTSAAHTHTTGNHTLTINEMPSHSHIPYFNTSWGSRVDYPPVGSSYIGPQEKGTTINYNGTSTGTYVQPNSGVLYNEKSGGGQAHNHGNTGSTTPGNTGSSLSSTFDITPACEAAYCWKRIS